MPKSLTVIALLTCAPLPALAQTPPGSEPAQTRVQCAVSNQRATLVLVTPVFDRDVGRDMHGIFNTNVVRLIGGAESAVKRRLIRDGAVPRQARDAWTGRCWIARDAMHVMIVDSVREHLDPAQVMGGRRFTKAIEAYIPNWRALLTPDATWRMLTARR